ncbi:hypothetical protein YC2023_060629 [Brassica napus]
MQTRCYGGWKSADAESVGDETIGARDLTSSLHFHIGLHICPSFEIVNGRSCIGDGVGMVMDTSYLTGTSLIGVSPAGPTLLRPRKEPPLSPANHNLQGGKSISAFDSTYNSLLNLST